MNSKKDYKDNLSNNNDNLSNNIDRYYSTVKHYETFDSYWNELKTTGKLSEENLHEAKRTYNSEYGREKIYKNYSRLKESLGELNIENEPFSKYKVYKYLLDNGHVQPPKSSTETESTFLQKISKFFSWLFE